MDLDEVREWISLDLKSRTPSPVAGMANWANWARQILLEAFMRLQEAANHPVYGDVAIETRLGSALQRFGAELTIVEPPLPPQSGFLRGLFRREARPTSPKPASMNCMQAETYVREVLEPVLASRQNLGSVVLKEGDWVNGYQVARAEVELVDILAKHQMAAIRAVQNIESLTGPRFSYLKPVLVREQSFDGVTVRRRVANGPQHVLRSLSNPWVERFALDWIGMDGEGRHTLLSDETNLRQSVIATLRESNPDFLNSTIGKKHADLCGVFTGILPMISSRPSGLSELHSLLLRAKSDFPYKDPRVFEAKMFECIDDCVAEYFDIRSKETRKAFKVLGDVADRLPVSLISQGSILLPTLPMQLPSSFYSFARWTREGLVQFRSLALIAFLALNPTLASFAHELLPLDSE